MSGSGLSRLGLGTVQFGFDYGISNAGGRVAANEAARIVARAAAAGVRYIDTAADYGVSEETLGEVLVRGVDWRVVTKTARPGGAAQVEVSLRRSLERLRRDKAYGLLAHHAEDLLDGAGAAVFAEMRRMKALGLVAKIGASVYTAQQVDALLSRYEFDLIQVPFNVLDQRLIAGGQLKALKKRGIEIHARSAFLQGALLMEPDELPAVFAPAREHIRGYRAETVRRGLSPLHAALSFVMSIREIDAVVCGVVSAEQFEEVLAAAGREADVSGFERFALGDERILNPALWSR